MTGLAQQRQTGDVMYVYQKDGNIQAFLRDEIREMSYSMEDTLGVTHDEIVSQLIAVDDSIYNFPLTSIDSISFVTPPPVYLPGVIRLDGDLLPYVESCDSATIRFAASTPASLMPKVGDKLGFGYLSEKFPYGFAGKVIQVNGNTVECEFVEIGDIFETFYCVSSIDCGQREVQAPRRGFGNSDPYEKDIPLDPIELNMTNQITELLKAGMYAFKGENEFVIKIEPTLHMKLECFQRPLLGFACRSTFSGDINALTNLSVYGYFEIAKDFCPPEFEFKLPYGFTLMFKIGAFIKGSADITGSLDMRQHATYSSGFVFGTPGMGIKAPASSLKITEDKTKIKRASLDGRIGAGGVFEIGLAWLKEKVAKGVFRAEFGPQYRSNFILTETLLDNAKKNTDLYDRLKDRYIERYMVTSTSFDFYAFEKYGFSRPAPWGNEQLTDKWDLVPKFYNPSLKQNRADKTTAEGSVVARGDCAFENTLGVWLRDNHDRWLDMDDWLWISDRDFKSGRQDLKYTFKDLKDDGSETYTFYPYVFLGGVIPILASPSAELEKEPFPVSIVNFEQTSSHYSKQQGYEYEGRNYFYKFNATTTVELDPEVKDVKDWGYIYHDIYDKDKKISCANLGSNPFADQRYAYYFNDRERTVILTPYVQYEGSSEIEKGTELTFFVEYDLPVHIISFEQTGSDYSEAQDFIYEGVGYFYKFNATTSVELDNEEMNIRDWGYIYHDFYGEDKKISCANLGSNPYDDMRYAYYSNDPKRSVELSPYIQYIGEADIQLGKKRTFPLVYSVQTEMEYVDLGLPSGTLWAACNIGAKSPEEAGGYFSWGELSEKERYVSSDYQYHHYYVNYGDGAAKWSYYNQLSQEIYGKELDRNDVSVWDDIGENISGTEYDIATKYGGRMPTVEDCEELRVNCQKKYLYSNGVLGTQMTGPNGNSIFIPYTGAYIDYTYSDNVGLYWTGNVELDSSGNRKGFLYEKNAMSLTSDYIRTTPTLRSNGYPIRAVKKP